ncbi:iron ABC transporter permease [Ramlibacter sp. G-1-2-2]|uniref:Iron ABC transporter permease n=1 Tax=Ramlibacter agri TaxID=2728837 RepID=A0A848H476_9BURK|nr:iron ABC transporter permease [Ramlibacter agri]NML45307.1 iron ABC transporter permease [Ramlibacter agri]
MSAAAVVDRRGLVLGFVLLLVAALVAAVGAGVGSTGFESVLRARHDAAAWQILWDIRLPRTLGAWAAGALLGLAGAVAQGLFRNPLADPYLLGSASGAALGVALALVFVGASPFAAHWLPRVGLTGAAFCGAVVGVLMTLVLARGVLHTLRLLLAGVIVGVVLGAARDLLTLAVPDTLQAMQGFMLGTTGFVGWPACGVMLALLVPLLAVAWALGRMLDALALGEATAASLGLPLGAMRAALVAVLALATGGAVAQTGLIGFVGLAAPHLVRSFAPVPHGRLVLLAALMGGLLLMGADVLARWLIAPQELPVGVLTAVLGGTYLLWLMHRRSRRGVFS